MLYGFTGTMVALINSFSASQPQLIGMASLLGVAFLMASLGAVAAGPNRRSEGDLIFSWAVVSSVFTVFGTLKFFSCTAIPFGLAILSIAALMFLWHRQGRVGPVDAWKAATLVPRLPTAILTTGIMVLAFIALVCGIILDSVCRGRRDAKRMYYLAHPEA